MSRTENRENSKAYMRYVLDYLESNMQILEAQGFYTLSSLASREGNFRQFIKKTNSSKIPQTTLKNFKDAFQLKKAPERPTLFEIHSSFNIPLNFGQFEKEVEKKNQNFTKFFHEKTEDLINKVGEETFSLFSKPLKDIEPANNADLFYNGLPPDWSHVAAEFDFERSDYKKAGGIKEDVFDIIKGLTTLKFYIIKGVGGTGKTTILKRLAFDLSKSLSNIYYLDTKNEKAESFQNIFTEIKSLLENTHKKIVFLINDFANLITPYDLLNLNNIIKYYPDKKVLFIFTENSINYNNLHHKGYLMPEFLRTVKDLKPLDDSEIDSILNKIETLENENKLTRIYRNLSIDEIKALCKERFGRHLLVALMQIRRGKRFPEIIVEETKALETVDNFSFNAYLIICLFSKIGFPIDDELIFQALGKEWFDGSQNLNKYCFGLIVPKNGIHYPRHEFIANKIFDNNYENNNVLILKTLKKVLNPEYIKDANNEEYVNLLIDFFKTKNIHFKLLEIFNYDADSIRAFYETFKDSFLRNRVFRAAFYSSLGLFEKAALKHDNAISAFLELLKIEKSGFAYRMLAYSYQDSQKWNKSTEFALIAFDFASTDEKRLEAAEILSYNEYDNFLKAEPLYKRLKNSKDKKIKEKCEQYFSVLSEIKQLKVSDNEEIDKFIMRKLRPKLVHMRSLLLNTSTSSKVNLYELLTHQQDNISADYSELIRMKLEFDSISDTSIKAFYYRMLAGALKKRYDNMQDDINFKEIEDLYKYSIELNTTDAFTHNYYATFLKDIMQELHKAEDEYREAIKVGDSSKTEYYHRHPKFLNDLALLIEVQVELKIKDKEAYNEAIALYREADERAKIVSPKFTFPKENLKKLLSKIKNG